MQSIPGRDALIQWRQRWPRDFFAASADLSDALVPHLGQAQTGALAPALSAFGATIAQLLDPAVEAIERDGRYPRLVTRDAVGREVQRVEFDPRHHETGRAIWRSGLLALSASTDSAFAVAARLWLLGHAGEGGHACPIACTLGLIRALQVHGGPELRARFLPHLTSVDYDQAHRAAQWLTEIQGGSDVGANLLEAKPDPVLPGAWRLDGEKWFCSVADAEQIAVTARVLGGGAGTAGLGLFLVPRHRDDGTVNGLHLWRLKDKLGSRGLATGEVAFRGAVAWPIGALADGFKIAAGVILNTSRWCNALACAGAMQRAYLLARSYADHRHAFGRPIRTFAGVTQALAEIASEAQAALASTLELTAAIEPAALATGSEADRAWYRFLVNANKLVTALAATSTVRRAIEVLGGHGVIEDFSPLPRLLRDCLVFEAWEGAHDVLCAQVGRDLQRPGAADAVLARIRGLLRAPVATFAAAEAGHLAVALDNLEARLRRSLEDPRVGELHFRAQAVALLRCVQGACLLREAALQSAGRARKLAIAELHFRRHLWPSYDAEADPSHAARLRAIAGDQTPASS